MKTKNIKPINVKCAGANSNNKNDSVQKNTADKEKNAVKNTADTYTPPCPLYKRCSGCQLQNMPYNAQLKWKQKRINMLLGRFCKAEKIIGMVSPEHYRSKLQAVYRQTTAGELITGVYQSSNGGIVATENCMLTDAEANKISGTLARLFKSFKIKPYNPRTGKGYVKNVLIRCGGHTGEVMVVIVTAREENYFNRSFINALISSHPRIKTVILSVNQHSKLLNGKQIQVLYGDGKITTKICECNFMLSSDSFCQVNPLQTEVLYSKAIEMAELTGKEKVIDAYCGVGTIGIIAARNAGTVTSVELNPDAASDAMKNAVLNERSNVKVIRGDAGKFMSEMAQSGEKADVVFTDPPRAGCSRMFLNSLLKLSPDRIVYISCNPESLARDLIFLCNSKYRVKKIQPVDMFPYTNHVETVVLMSRKDR